VKLGTVLLNNLLNNDRRLAVTALPLSIYTISTTINKLKTIVRAEQLCCGLLLSQSMLVRHQQHSHAAYT
jgi:hypothetical protein